MKVKLLLFVVAVLFLFNIQVLAQDSKLNPITNPTLDELRKNFENPHRDFSTGPLWTWNDRLTDEQVRGTLRDLAGQHVKQVWVHPRPGLMTPYLSDEWFARWKTALDEAEKLDMNVWIYDENSYPSGFAGGFVPEALPDSRGMGLKFEEVEKLDQWDKNIWYVFCPQDILHNILQNILQENSQENPQDKDFSYKNITAESKAAEKLEPLPNGKKYLLAKIQYTPQGGWFGGKWYVDLLKKGVTEKFLDITLDVYKNVPEIQKQFGKRVPGIFTDEPHPAGSYVGTWITWNEEIPELFEKRFGYSLIDNLPSLSKNIGDWKKIRHNYHQLILDLFVERWAKPYFERCEKYGLEFTGHYWEHGWPNTSHGPDNMAMYAWHQRPAIDLLMNNYNDNSPNAQFGNVRSVKELASIANQMGHSRTLSENYGAGGWDIRFEDLKRLGDWSYALGVNTNNEHLSYVTIKGARKRDHPQSFSYHASWFEGYHVLADYFTRLSYMLSQGRQKSRVVIIEPTTTAWMYQGDPKLNEIGQSFTDFLTSMERVRSVHHAKPEYDLASEDIIKRFGKVDGKYFIIGQAIYEKVILPPMMENLNQSTLDILAQYSESDGTIICTGTVPTYIDGCKVNNKSDSKNATLIKKLSERYGSVKKTVSEVVAEVSVLSEQRRDDYFRLRTDDESASSVFFHRRQLDDCDIVFICNTNLTKTAKGDIDVIHNQIEEWDLVTGEIRPLNLSLGGLVRMPHIHYFYKFELPPAGSVLLVLSEKTGIKRKEIETNKDEKSSPISKEVKPPTNPLKQQRFDSLIIKDNFDAKTQKNITPIPALNSETKVRRLEDNVLTLDYVDVKVGDEERKDIYAWAANRFVFQKHGMTAGNPWDNQVQFKDELITKKFPEKSGFEAAYHFTLRESIPNNLAIVIERPDLYKIYCNDKEVNAISGAWWLDKSFGKIDLSGVAKIGENNVKIVAQSMTIEHELEPAYLLGDFSLQNAEKGFIVVPPQELSINSSEVSKTSRHNEELERVAWLSAGVGFRPNKPAMADRSPTLEFDFGREQKVDAIRIWNYNEQNLKQRGVKTVEISGLGKVDLPIGDGSSHELSFPSPQTLKTISFKILSNHNGVTYPIPENVQPKDNGFVGLAEVQFLTKENGELTLINNVIANASSELVIDSHNRKAIYLIDNSGFDSIKSAWNQQGMPFYSGKVEYSKTFEIEKIDSSKKYMVQISAKFPYTKINSGWYGSTAQIVVNGQSAGFAISTPYGADITKFIKSGKNEVAVIIYGTPKNLLGPHHAGTLRGSAWPNAFHRAPEHQPNGAAYDTIGYGLFEPSGLFCWELEEVVGFGF